MHNSMGNISQNRTCFFRFGMLPVINGFIFGKKPSVHFGVESDHWTKVVDGCSSKILN